AHVRRHHRRLRLLDGLRTAEQVLAGDGGEHDLPCPRLDHFHLALAFRRQRRLNGLLEGEDVMKRLLAAAAVAALAACNPAGPQDSGAAPSVQLYALDCGRADFPNVDMFADDGSLAGQSRELVVPCFLIRHPEGDLIWDTGFPDAVAAMPGGRPELPEMGATVTLSTTLAAQLEQLGLAPADVEYLSFSHLHGDHTGNGNLFAASTWIVDADERAAMFAPDMRGGQEFAGYAQLEN